MTIIISSLYSRITCLRCTLAVYVSAPPPHLTWLA